MKKQSISAWVTDEMHRAIKNHPKLQISDVDRESLRSAFYGGEMTDYQKIVARKSSQLGSSCSDIAIQRIADILK